MSYLQHRQACSDHDYLPEGRPAEKPVGYGVLFMRNFKKKATCYLASVTTVLFAKTCSHVTYNVIDIVSHRLTILWL